MCLPILRPPSFCRTLLGRKFDRETILSSSHIRSRMFTFGSNQMMCRWRQWAHQRYHIRSCQKLLERHVFVAFLLCKMGRAALQYAELSKRMGMRPRHIDILSGDSRLLCVYIIFIPNCDIFSATEAEKMKVQYRAPYDLGEQLRQD